MTLKERFDAIEDEFLRFERVPSEYRVSTRADLCAFMLLDRLVARVDNSDMVIDAAHDQIWLDTDVEVLQQVATDDDILTLTRCGVWLDNENGLSMFV